MPVRADGKGCRLMTRGVFRIGGWAALMVGSLAAVSAAVVVVIGALALTGRVTYPVDIGPGPFSIQDGVSVPVGFAADVCQQASVWEQTAPSDCLRFFMHTHDGAGNGGVHVQDADVRPISATLTGTVELATTGGWSPLVAVSVARNALGLAVVSAVLILLWRLLTNAAAGNVFSVRAVRYVRGIGWLLIVVCVVEAMLGLLSIVAQHGYSIQQFGYGAHLASRADGGFDFSQLALGGLVLLLAEVFRYGATVEAERRLTI